MECGCIVFFMLKWVPMIDLTEVEELARNPTQKIRAIKRYREVTGQDLRESKDAVEHFIAHGYWLGRSEIVENQEKYEPGASQYSFAEVEKLARNPASKIRAIKEYRLVTGQGLKDCKDAVEYFIENGVWSQASIQSKTPQRIEELVKEDRSAQAIEMYRDLTGASLEQAREDVSHFVSRGFWSKRGLLSQQFGQALAAEDNVINLEVFRTQKQEGEKNESSEDELLKLYRAIANTPEKEMSITQQDILDWMLMESKKQMGMDLSGNDIAMDRFAAAAREAGVELAASDTVEINLPFLAADHTGPKHFQAVLTADMLKNVTSSPSGDVFNPASSQQEVFAAFRELGMDEDEVQEIVQRAVEAGHQDRKKQEEAASSAATGENPSEDWSAPTPQKQTNDALQLGLLILGLLGLLAVMGGLVAYLLG